MAEKKKQTLDIVARYDYRTAEGAVIYQVVQSRNGSKRVRSPDEKDPSQWRWGRAKWGITAVPYRLPELIKAAASGAETMWIVPDERAADDLAKNGIVATCAIWDGEPRDNGWKKEWSPWIKFFDRAVVIARNDPPPEKRDAKSVLSAYLGQRRASEVLAAIHGNPCVIRKVKCLTLPAINGDRIEGPSQWLDAGGTIVSLLAAVRAAPPWECPDAMDECTPGELARMASDIPGASGSARPDKENPAATSSLSAGLAPAAATPAPPSDSQAAKNVGGSCVSDDEKPSSVASLRGALLKIYADRSLERSVQQKLADDTVVAWLLTRGKFYRQAELKTHGNSMYFDSVEKRLNYTGRDFFASWLSLAMSVNPASPAFKYALARVQSESMAGEHTQAILPDKYWARRGNKAYLSCGNGRMVRCSPEGAETVDMGTDGVLFEEGRECLPWNLLPGEGLDPFETCLAFTGMTALYPRGKVLLKLWAMSMPGHGELTKPVLLLTGKGRSGKTMVARQIQRLYGLDDVAQPITKEYKIDSFWTNADAGGMFTLDNADYYVDWLVGAICTVATGSTYSKRANYKDNELVKQRARCWVAITGVRPYFASEDTVVDRLVTVELGKRMKGNLEGELFEDMDANRNAGLTWICRCWCRALADKAEPPPQVLSRHPGWGRTAYRLARAAGFEDEAVDAMSENEAGKAVFSLRQDALGQFIVQAYALSGFEGSMTDMHEGLKTCCDDFDPKEWSKEKVGMVIKKRLWDQMVTAFKMTRKNHSNTNHYSLSSIPIEFLPPTMLGVEGSPVQSAHVGAITPARATPPPTPPTSQNIVEREGREEEWDL